MQTEHYMAHMGDPGPDGGPGLVGVDPVDDLTATEGPQVATGVDPAPAPSADSVSG